MGSDSRQISAYLSRPRRSLSEACQAAGRCPRGSAPCAACGLRDLCAKSRGDPKPLPAAKPQPAGRRETNGTR